tara:strand:- start:355 stop:1077 length:723 start_codon:yes stop_codon:yes gene_type:complete
MLRQDDQFVGGQFDWFIGVVEDTNDPKKLNRVKVRCFGYHTDDKAEVKVEDLPFATVMMPSTSPSVEGIGQNHQLLSGSWVIGFFRDGPSAQDPIILGSVMSFTETARDTSLGFSGTYGNKEGISDVPTEVDDLNANQVTKTVGGHLIELDNTSGEERINVKHKSGTTLLIDKNGGVHVNAINDIVTIDGNTTITGKLHVTEEQTNDKTIVAQGTITDSGATLASHTHPGDSGGNTGSPN